MSLPLGTASAFRRQSEPEPERVPIMDPVQWTRDRLDESPWSVQREIMRALVRERRVAVPACHGPGKSYIGSRLAGWWIDTHPLGEAFVVSSAPSVSQVKAILWRELVRAHRRGGLSGHITGMSGNGPVEWHIGGELVAFGRKPADRVDAEEAMQHFSGIHAPAVLVILDEATGVPTWLWHAATSLLTNEASRILALGNPDDPSSHFAEVCAPGSGWHVRPISAFETPLFTGEAISDEARRGLVSPLWVEEAERDYGGKDNPLYQSKVLGRFPDKSDTLVIDPAMIRKAVALELSGSARGAFGLDVARSPTGDESALYRVRGGVARRIDSWRGLPITAAPDQDSTVARTWRHVRATPAVPVVVDTDGLGAGAYDGLVAIREPHTLRVVPFSASGPARNPQRFDSRRSELWWEFRQAVDRGEVDLDGEDETLLAQLQTPRWRITASGRIHVETKEELARRGKRSPDRADAVIMGHVGEPIDLNPPGAMGETEVRQPLAEPDPQRRHVRVRQGEAAALRRRPM